MSPPSAYKIKSKMRSFLRQGSQFLTPSSSTPSLSDLASKHHQSDGFTTAPTEGALFTAVDPEVDGEECLRDCESCTIHLPRKWSIDEDDKLYGHVKGWSTHLLVATGKTDWVRDVEDEKGSVMEAIGKAGIKPSNGVSMLQLPAPRLV